MKIKQVILPLQDDCIKDLRAGDLVSLSGYLYTGRDAAHKRLLDAIKKNESLPFNLRNETIYYVGPAPSKPGKIIGSAGPTTSYRMDPFTVPLLDRGLKAMIGKGTRSQLVIEAIKRNGCIYFGAVGGAAALISKSIVEKELVAYEDLGPEAIYRLKVQDFPVIVVIDSRGQSLYNQKD